MNSDSMIHDALQLLDRVLAHQNEGGDFLGSDVHTYHLVEALNSLGPESFSPYINQALHWFESIDDPRDRNPRAVSPFKLLALTRGGRADAYRREAVSKILAHMVGTEGNINIPIGFVESPDVYDTFPTLAGISILIGSPMPEAPEVIGRALSWCISKLKDGDRPATLGFLAWTVTEVLQAGVDVAQETKDRAFQALRVALDDHASLEKDPLQAAYVAFDAAVVGNRTNDTALGGFAKGVLSQLLTRMRTDEHFYEGQDQALLDLRILTAIGAIMTAEDRAAFGQRLLAEAFSGKVAAIREYRALRGEAQRLVERIRALEAEHKCEGLFVQPRWTLPSGSNDRDTVFWLMPFPKEGAPPHLMSMEEVFQNLLRPAVEQTFGVSVRRADDIFDTGEIMQSIWENIVLARALVADLTGRNPNVFYEVGLADVLNKEVVLLSQTMEDVPFDLRSRRVLIYNVNYPGPDKLREELLKTLETVLEKRA